MAVIFASGCVGQGGLDILLQTLNLQIVTPGQFEEVSVVASIPELTRVGKEFDWKIQITPVNDIKNVNFEVYDPCIFTAKTPDTKKWDSINANRTEQFTITYVAGDTNFERTCDVKFKLTYDSNSTASQTIAVLSDTEYGQREVAGTLGDISFPASQTSSPLEVSITTNPQQPLLDNTNAQVYFSYKTSGVGFINDLSPQSVRVRYPVNLFDPVCDDFNKVSDGILELNREIPFVSNQGAKRSTCTFKTNAQKPIDSEPVILTATYSYEIDNSVPILVRPVSFSESERPPQTGSQPPTGADKSGP